MAEMATGTKTRNALCLRASLLLKIEIIKASIGNPNAKIPAVSVKTMNVGSNDEILLS